MGRLEYRNARRYLDGKALEVGEPIKVPLGLGLRAALGITSDDKWLYGTYATTSQIHWPAIRIKIESGRGPIDHDVELHESVEVYRIPQTQGTKPEPGLQLGPAGDATAPQLDQPASATPEQLHAAFERLLACFLASGGKRTATIPELMVWSASRLDGTSKGLVRQRLASIPAASCPGAGPKGPSTCCP